MKKNFIAVLLIGAIASTFTACSGKLSPTAAPAGSSSVPASLVSSASAAQDSTAQPDSSEPAVSYASTDSVPASSGAAAVTASGASAIKTGVVKTGLTVTAPASKAAGKVTAPASKATTPAKAPSKAPAKASTGTPSKPSSTSKPAPKPASKPSTTTPSNPAANPYAGYTAWVDTHNQDILTSMARNSPYIVDTYANDIYDTVTNSSTAPWDVQFDYDIPARDYGNGYISLDQLKAKFNKTYQVAFSSKHRFVVTAIYTDSAQYSRANPKDVSNQIKATGILNKKYSGLYYDFCYGYYTASNIKVGKAVRVTFILKQIS